MPSGCFGPQLVGHRGRGLDLRSRRWDLDSSGSCEFGKWTLACGLITHVTCLGSRALSILGAFVLYFGGSCRCPTRSRSTAPTAALVVSEPVSVLPVYSDLTSGELSLRIIL